VIQLTPQMRVLVEERILEAHAAQVLLSAGDFEAARGAKAWKRVDPATP
jgi:hypothetical protein